MELFAMRFRALCVQNTLLSLAMWAPGFAIAAAPVEIPVVECGAEIPVIKQDTKLSQNCTYRQSVQITQSHVTLNCQGATLDGDDSLAIGIHIASNKRISDITLKNCQVRRFTKRGVRVASKYSDSGKLALPPEERYLVSPTRVRIENVSIRDTREVGLYIDDYVTDTVVISSYVGGSGGAGVYLEHSSSRTHLSDSLIERNGWGRNPNRSREKGREGLAIDSSSENVIERNRFQSNAAGGIFLYRNCQEKASTNPDSVPRWQLSERNVIRDNAFEDQPVGVWLGSRQSMVMKAWDCGNAYYGEGNYVLDAAPRNIVVENRFVSGATGVVVEDDENTISDNSFREMRDACVRIGTEARNRYLHQPVAGTTLIRNTCDAHIPKDRRYQALFGTTISFDSSNY